MEIDKFNDEEIKILEFLIIRIDINYIDERNEGLKNGMDDLGIYFSLVFED